MEKRNENFEALKEHPWLGKIFKKLSAKELSLARAFLNIHYGASKGDFEWAVQRMFLDKEKPKNFSIIMELLTCANSQIKTI
jgi:hypothetical protein